MGAQAHFPELLSCNQRGRGNRPCHLGPSFQNLSHGDCVFTYSSKGGGKQEETGKERKRTLVLSASDLREAGHLDPLSLGVPGSSLEGTYLRNLKCLQ